jgi:hypothetical protein
MSTKNKLELIIEAVDRFTTPFRKMGKSLKQFYEKSGLQQVGKSLKGAASSLKDFGLEALKFGGLIGAATGGLFALAKATSTFGDGVAKTAERLGIGVVWLQKYRYAASLADISQQTFDMAMQRFTRRAAEAAAGTGVAKDALSFLNVELRDGQDKLKSSEQLLAEVADGMQEVEDPAMRVRIAFALFDSEGVKMINMLKNGSKAMKEQADEADKLGILTEDQIKASEEFNDELERLWRALKFTAYSIGAELIPVMSDFVKSLQELVIEFKPHIIDAFKSALKYLRDDLPKTVAGFFALTSPIISMVGWLDFAISNTIGWQRAIMILAGIIGGSLIKSLFIAVLSLGVFIKSIILATWRLGLMAINGIKAAIGGLISLAPAFITAATAAGTFAAAILVNPITWIVMGIVALVAAVWYLVKNWDGVKARLLSIWAGITEAFENGFLNGIYHLLRNFTPLGLIAGGINDLIKYLTNMDLGEIGAKWIGGLIDGIKGEWAKLTAWLSEAVEGLINMMPDWVKDRIGINTSVNALVPGANIVPSALPQNANNNFSGQVKVSFENTPPGTRIQDVRSSNSQVALDVDAGYAIGGV